MANVKQIAQEVAKSIALRGDATAEVETAKANTSGALKSCMRGIAGTFKGFNGSDDEMKAALKSGWFIYATMRKLADKNGQPYKSADDMPKATLSEYFMIAKAGITGDFAAADQVAEKAGAHWWRSVRDLIRAKNDEKRPRPISDETMAAILQKWKADDAAKQSLAGQLEKLAKAAKRLGKEHDLDVSQIVRAITAAMPEGLAVTAPNVVVLQPAQQPAQQPATAPVDIADLMARMDQMAAFQNKIAAFIEQPAKKAKK